MKKIALLAILFVLVMLTCSCSIRQQTATIDIINNESVVTMQPAAAKVTKAATKEPAVEAASSNEPTYIYNKNTHKFHYPYCSSVDDMKEKNKVYWYESREALMKRYPSADPCKRCKP